MSNAIPPAGHRSLDLLVLPAVAREAFARAVAEDRAPVAKRAGAHWILLAIAAIAMLVGVNAVGFGDPGDMVPIPPSLALGLDALGFAGLVAAVGLWRRARTLRRLLGCAPGIYALGSRLIDARSRTLELYDLRASDPQITHHHVNGSYRFTSLSWHGLYLASGPRTMPDRVLTAVNWQLRVLRDAFSAGDVAQMLALDPIALGLAIIDSAPPAPPPPLASPRRPLAIAAFATLALAGSAWSLRNYASMEVAFARLDSASQIDGWIEAGGDRARGLHKKMEVELTRAVTENGNDASKLRDVLARYPDAPAELTGPVEAALARRYKFARAAALALSASEPLTAFINHVYDHLETTRVPLTMHLEATRTDTSALTAFDDGVAADPKHSPLLVRVAQYFDPAEDTVRTQAVKRAVQGGLGQFFPADVLVFSNTADATQATVTIFYIIRMKASAVGDVTIYQAVDAHHVPIAGSPEYPGVELELGATLEVPGGDPPQRVTFIARPAPSITVEKTGDGYAAASAATSAEVYRAMAASAFADLQLKLVHALGGKPDVDDRVPEPREPACEKLDREVAKLQACASVTAPARTQLAAELRKLAVADLDTKTFCTRAKSFVQRSFLRANCDATAPAAATDR